MWEAWLSEDTIRTIMFARLMIFIAAFTGIKNLGRRQFER